MFVKKYALDVVLSRADLSEHIKIGQLMALISAAIDNSGHLNFLLGLIYPEIDEEVFD